MKYFILLMTLLYLFSILKSLCPFRTAKQSADTLINQNKNIDKNIFAITCYILLVPILIYIFLSAVYVNTFLFTIICFAYMIWTCSDLYSNTQYIEFNKVSKTLDSKLYKILSFPLDLGFVVFLLYYLFMNWGR